VGCAIVLGAMIWYSKSRKQELLVPADETPARQGASVS
jgi:hypothetical protein